MNSVGWRPPFRGVTSAWEVFPTSFDVSRPALEGRHAGRGWIEGKGLGLTLSPSPSSPGAKRSGATEEGPGEG